MKDFNRLNVWMPPKMKKFGLSAEKLGRACEVSRTAIYNYLKDEDRPSEQVMVRMCRVFGVPLEEGLRQYTPKKTGRPKSQNYTTPVTRR